MSIQFNAVATKDGLIQKCEAKLFGEDYGYISNSTARMATFTSLLNDGLNRLSEVIAESDTRWQFHDSNYTTHPIATTDLNTTGDGQQDYRLSETHFEVRNLYVMDSEGSYVPLVPIDEYDMAKHGVAPSEFMKEGGMPQYYDKKGLSVFLYPKPLNASVTATEGLKVSYVAPPSYFAIDDTTKTAGVPSKFQLYPVLHACMTYAGDNEMAGKFTVNKLAKDEMEISVQLHMARRDKDDKPRLVVRRTNYS